MSYNSGSNGARNFKSALRFALARFRNYSPDYSLNCTPLGPITITNNSNNDNNNSDKIRIIVISSSFGLKYQG